MLLSLFLEVCLLFSLTTAQLFDTPDLVDMVTHYEGFQATPYLCPAGVWTIGYGHTGPDVREDSPAIHITEGRALLIRDLTQAGTTVLDKAGEALGRSESLDAAVRRFIALTSWTFNLGEGNLASSTLLKRLHAGRWEDAAAAMLRWDKATVNGKKRTLAGLTKRRKTEAHYFRTGEVKFFQE